MSSRQSSPSPEPDISHSVTRRTAREKKVGLFGQLSAPTHKLRHSNKEPDANRTKSPLPPFPPNRHSSPKPIPGPSTRQTPTPGTSSAGSSVQAASQGESLDWDGLQVDNTISGHVIDNRDRYTSTSQTKERSISEVLRNNRLIPPTSSGNTSEEETFHSPDHSRPTSPSNPKPPKKYREPISSETERVLNTSTDTASSVPPSPTRSTVTIVPAPISGLPTPEPGSSRASGGSSQNLRTEEVNIVVAEPLTTAPEQQLVDEQQPTAEQAATMAEIIQSKIAIQKGLDYVEEEAGDDYQYGDMPLEDLKDTIKRACKLKDGMSEAMAHLMITDQENFKAHVEPQARMAKRALVSFIAKGRAFLKQTEDRRAYDRDAVANATLNIKMRRVTNSLSDLQHKADVLFASLDSIKTANCETDNELRILLENYSSVTKELEDFLKDVQSLYSDAVTTGMEVESETLEKLSNKLKTEKVETNKAVNKKKALRGCSGQAGPARARIKDLKPPSFSGIMSDGSTDYFTFKTEFLEYVESQGNSNEEQVDLLRKTCLTGSARSIVIHLKTLDEIWDKLKSSYGDPTLLIHSKTKALEKLGKCPDHGDKRRSWFIETHSKVSRLLELATEHKQDQELYHSDVMGIVRMSLPDKLKDEFKKKVWEYEKDNNTDLSKPQLFTTMLEFLVTCIATETFNLKFDQQMAFNKTSAATVAGPKATEGMNKGKARKTYAAQQQSSNPQASKGGSGNNNPRKQKPTTSKSKPTIKFEPQDKGPPKGVNCSVCSKEHTHLYECKNFQQKSHIDRISLSHYLRICFKCMRMDSRVYKPDMEMWFNDHKKNCETDYLCDVGNCQADPSRPAWRRRHVVMCEFHSADNAQLLLDFVATLDAADKPANHKFFFMETYNMFNDNVVINTSSEVTVQEDGTRILPDVMLPSIYMVQNVPGKGGLNLLVFFDSGCSSASMSTRAYKILDCEQARPGPTLLNVAGGKVIKIPYGDERFLLELEDKVSTKATISALRMDQVTSSFPYWPLQAAWDLLSKSYSDQYPEGHPLPPVDEGVGGVEVDIMLGIRYNQYFPVQLFMLPGGLAIYRAQFKTVTGNQGVLGGTHESWGAAAEKAHFMGPAAYFTAEVKAHQDMSKTLSFIDEFDDIHLEYEGYMDEPSDHENDDRWDRNESDGLIHGCKKKSPFFQDHEKRSNVEKRSLSAPIFFKSSNNTETIETPPNGSEFLRGHQKDLPDHSEALGGRTTSEKDFSYNSLSEPIFFKSSNNTETIETPPNGSEFLRGYQKDLPDHSEALGGHTASEKDKKYLAKSDKNNFSATGFCAAQHCEKHHDNDDWMYPENWDLSEANYSVLQEEKQFIEAEDMGTEVSYRCVACRNCLKCKDSELQEKISLNEEVEQALVERSLRLEAKSRKLWAKLPFIKDPAVHLNPNRYLAEKIFDRQMRTIVKNPEMREDVLKSHAKLESRGFVIKWDEIPEDYKERLEAIPGPGYIIPWQIVYKLASLSTPIRMVMNGSCATPGGESLNTILAKGANTLTKIFDILIGFRTKPCALTCDIRMAYNGLMLEPEFYKFQRYLWKEGLDPTNPTIIMCIITVIYGIKPSGQQTIAAFRLLADYCIENHPEHTPGALAVKNKAYMDDVGVSTNSPEENQSLAASISFTLALGSLAVKAFAFSGMPPPEEMSGDGIHVGVLGYLWDTLKDSLKLDIKPICFEKPKKGKIPPPVTDNLDIALAQTLTKRTLVSQCAKIFDPLGLTTPITAKLKLDLHEVADLKVQWDEALPLRLIPVWVENLRLAQRLSEYLYPRTVVPRDAKNTDLHLISSCDASIDIAIACIHGCIEKKDGNFACTLLAAKSKLVKGSTVPRAELKAAVLASNLYHNIKKNIKDQFKSVIFVSDSTICLYWISQDYRPLQISVRNSVIEIKRLTLPEQWYHVESEMNLADLGTRPANLEEISPTSDWFLGKPWMREPREKFKIKPIEQLTLENSDKVAAAKEMKAPDIGGHMLDPGHDKVGQRYAFSKYPVDPCHCRWPVSVDVLAFIFRFVDIIKKRPVSKTRRPTAEERAKAENFLFRITTKEVKQFSKEKEWKHNSVMKDRILYRTDRVLEARKYNALENVMVDLEPMMFVKPIVDRYSPVAYSIMIHCHSTLLHHANAVATLRESLNIAHIIGGRDLANEVRETCAFCRRYKKKFIQVELGKVHKNRLTISPAFSICQVDILGPLVAVCEHHHRSTVKIWGLVFKCPATCAVAAHVMVGYDASSVCMAYTRFASRYGHPIRLYIDQGTQLVKAAKEMNIDVIDLFKNIEVKFEVGIEFQTGPVAAHHTQGQVERSIQEIKKLFFNTYKGVEIDIMAYETAFSWVCNELNSLPLFLGSKYRNIDHLDLITPNRLLLGRNNRRALSGCVTLDVPSRMMKQMNKVYDAWWEVWRTEKLQDFIPKASKWPKTDHNTKVGDVVIFKREKSEKDKKMPPWRVGQVVRVEPDSDDLVRKIIIEYKNSGEEVFRETRRSARDVALLVPEGESSLADSLNQASKEAGILYYLSPARKPEEPEPWGWQTESIFPPSREAQGPRICSSEEHKEEPPSPSHSGAPTSTGRKRSVPCPTATLRTVCGEKNLKKW